MLNSNKHVGVEVLLYFMDDFLLNEKVGCLEKRLFNWWLEEGFFLVSNFKETENGVSAEFMLLLGGSIYDVTRNFDAHTNEMASVKEPVQQKIDEGWDLILKVKPNFYVVEDTLNNRQHIEELFKNNIRNFDFVEYKVKQEGEKRILKSIVINVIRNR